MLYPPIYSNGRVQRSHVIAETTTLYGCRPTFNVESILVKHF